MLSRKEQMMFISIRKYKLNSQDAKTRGELTRQINDLFLPQISKSPGFVSYYAADTGSGTLATVSVFESQSGAEESNRQAGFCAEEFAVTRVGAARDYFR
jgi:hypothetical protein